PAGSRRRASPGTLPFHDTPCMETRNPLGYGSRSIIGLQGNADMSNAAETKTQAYHQLATYLRRNPDAVNHSSAELADRFGLPEEVVSDVQVAVRDRHARHTSEGLPSQNLVKPTVALFYGSLIQPIWQKLRVAWRSWTARPSWFVGVTSVVGIACQFALSQFHRIVQSGTDVRIELDAVSS